MSGCDCSGYGCSLWIRHKAETIGRSRARVASSRRLRGSCLEKELKKQVSSRGLGEIVTGSEVGVERRGG